MVQGSLSLKNKTLKWGSKTYIMGILNLTPDSFSGDGIYSNGTAGIEAILNQAEQMMLDGADIIDIGGESTRPNAKQVGVEEEISRVALAVETIAKRLDVIISIDTYKSKVAATALELGASIVNDVWALQGDPEMAQVVAKFDALIVLMHNSSDPAKTFSDAKLGGSYQGSICDDIIASIKNSLAERIQFAEQQGIKSDKIIVDPGFGFGKTVAQNLEALARLKELSSLQCPILSGTSRKSFIGHALNLAVDDRLAGTLAAVSMSIERGADIVRVHDVKEAKRVASLVDAVVR
jgi:dihydropteroate synthase